MSRYVDIRGVPWRGGVKRRWGCRQRQCQFSVLSLAMSLEPLELRPTLLHGFPLIAKRVILNDLEWPFHVKFLCLQFYNFMRGFQKQLREKKYTQTHYQRQPYS